MKEVFKKVVVSILTAEASLVIKRRKPVIIAITGSVGKTSTKDAIFSAIKSSVRARKSEKSFNSDIGVPLTVLGLPNGWNNPLIWLRNIVDGFLTVLFPGDYPKVLVLETGIDRPGDMSKLTRWLKPNIVVLTRLPDVPSHVEYFGSKEAVVEEKMKLVLAMKPNGVLVYNHDDEIIKSKLPEVIQKQVGFSRYLESDFTARNDKITYRDDVPCGTQFEISTNGKLHKIKLKDTVGSQHSYACAAAMAVATQLEIPEDTAAKSLSDLSTPKGRMRIIKGLKGTTVIDDTYNSSPVAVSHAIETLKEINYAKRKIAVLGDMLELGKFSSIEHKKVGEQVVGVFDVLITVGVRARQIAEGALSAGMSEENILQYEEAERAGRELQNLIKVGDVILVKASQGVRSEKIVEEIMNDPERADELLVRQDKTWKNIA